MSLNILYSDTCQCLNPSLQARDQMLLENQVRLENSMLHPQWRGMIVLSCLVPFFSPKNGTGLSHIYCPCFPLQSLAHLPRDIIFSIFLKISLALFRELWLAGLYFSGAIGTVSSQLQSAHISYSCLIVRVRYPQHGHDSNCSIVPETV